MSLNPASKTTPRGVLLDIDGTLVDSVDFHAFAWQRAFREHGKHLTFAEIRSQIGKGADTLLPVFLDEKERARCGDDIAKTRGRIFKKLYLDRVRPFPEVRALCERLRADGWQLALASSGPADEVAHHKKLLGIADLLDAETTADDVEKSKPHPDIFEVALKKLDGVAPEHAWVIGDTPYDAEAARKAGAHCLGVLCGGFPEADLRAAGAEAIFRDPADLLTRYAESPLARPS
ncbi:MAG: HAD family hydrolase [Verrucomicrobia bacterium]|nr:HAD family hydrolase [Verrucomicrobiota bacterium]